MTEEEKRVIESTGSPEGWRQWGPYLSDRAWGTVREDYSADGNAWDYFPHDHARSRAFRWSEDGLGGISDIRQTLCFALSLWNGQDPILKERMFGLTGPQGNHGEDDKEYWFYLDATPTASYLKFLYKYPQTAYPYQDLIDENARRTRMDPEYELLDTGAFAENRYWDVMVEYAKSTPDDIAIRITVTNRGPEAATLHLLPTLWFRNTWGWGMDPYKPEITQSGDRLLRAYHHKLGERYLLMGGDPDALLFTENETDNQRLFGTPNASSYVKDAFHERVIHGKGEAVNPALTGTKAAAWYRLEVGAGESTTLRLRLSGMPTDSPRNALGAGFDTLFATRIAEADEFYHQFAPPDITDDARAVQRQAYAGLIWSKQYYHYHVDQWLDGDPGCVPPPVGRKKGRNARWRTFAASDILSMPDPWEYPWFAAWDLAFHMIPFAQIDPDFAKHQLTLLCREWYMHPNGQLPAYEWAFDDVNPPVHAWAALRVFQIERKALQERDPNATGDVAFLERIFHKLLLNFTWWVNRKDAQGNNIFEGGFLGLDNIGVFDRSAPLPTGGYIEQSDGTAWMATYCLNMLAIAIELAAQDTTYQDVATKFAEHFIYIAHALTNIGEGGDCLWDEHDGFFYDVLHLPDDTQQKLYVRSIVGLIPLLAVEAFEADVLARVPDFHRRVQWFLKHKPNLAMNVAHITQNMNRERILFSLLDEDRLRRVLARMLDATEFLGPHGIRALSQWHKKHPFTMDVKGTEYRVDYQPAESQSGLFGGNSNWRGPVWFPINYLLIEALQRYDFVYGPSFTIEYPTGSGQQHTLGEIAAELSRRLTRTFLRDETGRRPVYGGIEVFQNDPHWRDNILFHEYFHGDNGAGLGASHQTGWTALVAKLISQSGN